jgi:DGQHR domain-containing protein
MGFQRLLDEKRAADIAKYIDEGLGTVPSSIILSAQSDAELHDVGKGKTIEFRVAPRAFLVLDGQHRIYGFSKAKSKLRVPVVIYTGLSRRDETRLFIDINSKQKGVPSELLFDIKKLAEYENSTESRLREVYDIFHKDSQSCLLGLTSPASKQPGKISRSTFNLAVKPLLDLFEGKDAREFYYLLNSYLIAFKGGMANISVEEYFPQNIVFRSIIAFFPSVAEKVQDKHDGDYTIDNFSAVLEPLFETVKPSIFKKPGNSFKDLTTEFESALKTRFRL